MRELPHGSTAIDADAAIPSAASEARRLVSQPAWPALAAIVLGGAIVLGVGFGPGVLHNAAHDTRHALVFPCH